MAIDRNRTKELLEVIDGLFEQVTAKMPEGSKTWLKETIFGPAITEIEELIVESRAPIMYFIGRSGHGKSSLINALANKEIAEVGDIKPTTAGSTAFTIIFEEAYSTWKVVDTRGIFETTSPEGAPTQDTLELLKADVKRLKPDILFHVITATEARALEKDFIAFKEIEASVKEATGVTPPIIVVLNKVDILGNPREWPPEEAPKKAGLITKLLDYMATDVLNVKTKGIDLNFPIKGYQVLDSDYVGIIPVSALAGDLWNIETLSLFTGDYLPKSTLLSFYQAQRKKKLLQKISTSLITKFSAIAGGVGVSPIPLSDIVVLAPLQILMIAIIGGLSCRPFSKETAIEYLMASGIDMGAGFALRYLNQQLVKLVPGAGWAFSGSIAASSTYGIGKSAEAYFFHGQIIKPKEFMKDD